MSEHRHIDFIKKEAKLATNSLRQRVSDVCDKVYGGDRYRRQWVFIEIMKESIDLMNVMKIELDYQEQEIKDRSDNMYHYLQDETCPSCGHTRCKIHCNFVNCGKPIDWATQDGFQYIGSDGKIYPQNPDTSIHVLCHQSRTQPRDVYLDAVRNLVKEKGIEWKRRKRNDS